jgi:hypothetical protein
VPDKIAIKRENDLITVEYNDVPYASASIQDIRHQGSNSPVHLVVYRSLKRLILDLDVPEWEMQFTVPEADETLASDFFG